MKFSLFKNNQQEFVCKECKMEFQSKESLEKHKKKARHFTGAIYFGKKDS
jgi:hypothetical protein